MSDPQPPVPSEQNPPGTTRRRVLTGIAVFAIIALTVGVIAWLTRPPEKMATPAPPTPTPSVTPSPTPSVPVASLTPKPSPTKTKKKKRATPATASPAEGVLTSISGQFGETSLTLLNSKPGRDGDTVWEVQDLILPSCPSMAPDYPDPATIVASRVMLGSTPGDQVEDQTLIVFKSDAAAKQFLAATKSASGSCQYEADPGFKVESKVADSSGLGEESIVVSSWSSEYRDDKWEFAPGAGVTVWARQGAVVVGANVSAEVVGDPLTQPELEFDKEPRAAVQHVLDQVQ